MIYLNITFELLKKFSVDETCISLPPTIFNLDRLLNLNHQQQILFFLKDTQKVTENLAS